MLDPDYMELLGVLVETEHNIPTRAFLARRGTADVNAIIRQFRAWISQKFPPGSASPAP
jgi:hypothetical protein